MAVKEEALETVKARVVVVGKEYSADNKVAVRVQDVADDGTLGAVRLYHPRDFDNPVVGHMYEYERTLDGKQFYKSTIRWVGPWKDEAKRLIWSAAARAFDVAEDAKRTAKKEQTRNLIRETMEPLRRAYWNTNAQGRRALSVLVLEYLQNGEISDG